MTILSFVGGPLHLQHQHNPATPEKLLASNGDGTDFTYVRQMLLTDGREESPVQAIYAPCDMSAREFLEGLKQLPIPDELD